MASAPLPSKSLDIEVEHSTDTSIKPLVGVVLSGLIISAYLQSGYMNELLAITSLH